MNEEQKPEQIETSQTFQTEDEPGPDQNKSADAIEREAANSDKRIIDPGKAHAMAEAGDTDRNQAAHDRKMSKVLEGYGIAKHLKETNVYHDQQAELKEEAAGKEYDEKKATDAAKRIVDPDKAHAMALAGDKLRSDAARERGFEGDAVEENDYQGADHHHNTAAHSDNVAEEQEEEAGRKYDEEHPAESSTTP